MHASQAVSRQKNRLLLGMFVAIVHGCVLTSNISIPSSSMSLIYDDMTNDNLFHFLFHSFKYYFPSIIFNVIHSSIINMAHSWPGLSLVVVVVGGVQVMHSRGGWAPAMSVCVARGKQCGLAGDRPRQVNGTTQPNLAVLRPSVYLLLWPLPSRRGVAMTVFGYFALWPSEQCAHYLNAWHMAYNMIYLFL